MGRMSATSMAMRHANFMAPLAEAQVRSQLALVVVNTARRLQDRYFAHKNTNGGSRKLK